MRRLALSLCLSLFGHLLLLGLVLLLRERTPSKFTFSGTEDGRGLRLSLGSSAAPRPPAKLPPLMPDEQEWNIDLEPPRLVATTQSSLPAELVVSTVKRSTSDSGEQQAAIHRLGGSGIESSGETTASGVGSSLLPVSEQITKIVYILDRSMSMGQHGVLDRAVKEIQASLRALSPRTRFQVLAYNRQVTPLVPTPSGLAPAESGPIAVALAALRELTPTGPTDHIMALRRGLALRPDVLFFLSDADHLTDEQVLAVSRENRSGTIIHVIELSYDTGPLDSALARLASLNRGTYRRVRP